MWAPMTGFLNIALFIAMGAVLVVLGWGIYSLFRGGDYARSRSNKLMRLRVLLQFIAVLILIGIMAARGLMGDA
jgi:heme/copper-type cytochrome/quinol oxidase subunit 2